MLEQIIIDKLSQKFKQNAGIIFKDCDLKFLELKVKEHLKILGISSLREYFEKMIVNNEIDKELDMLFPMIINKESSFFRYKEQFKLFTDIILPELIVKNNGECIKIWDAGISRGEEPYSLAMLINESKYLPDRIKYKIIATDIVQSNIDFAKNGIFDESIIKKLKRNSNGSYFLKYFTQANGFYFVNDELKENIEFKVHNLIKDEYFQDLDIIFCRNVIIYFDDNDKEKVLKKFVSALKVGGYLFLGHSEMLSVCKDIMKPIFEYDAVCYKKVGSN